MFTQHIINEHSNLEKRKAEFKYYCELCDFGTFSKDIYNKHIESNNLHNYQMLSLSKT